MNRCDNGARVVLAAVVTALVVLLPLAARAEVTYSETGGDQAVTVIRMTVTPAPAPVPALANRLVARETDLEPGNAAPYYYRAMLFLPWEPGMQTHWAKEKYGDDFERWYATGADAIPLDDLPLDKVREASKAFDGPVQQLAVASMRRTCDWELGVEDLRGPETFAFLLPEFGQSRDLGRILALKTRLAVAERRYDDALDTMRMNYRLGHDVGRVPFIVCSLIGIAEAGVAHGTAIELIAAPDSPNLYWALSELPRPMVEMREAVRLEMGFAVRVFPFLRDAETTERTPAEWNRLFTQSIGEMSRLVDDHGPIFNEFGAGLAATGLALAGYPYAKEQLVAQGMAPEQVEAMAVGQVMAIYTARTTERLTDDWEKLWFVPYWEISKRADAVQEELRAARPFEGGANREVVPMASILLPAITAVRSAEVRLERDVAALRVIEALRIYAAEHEGRLPASLGDVHEVPVPANPATGQAFAYHRDGNTGVLDLPASDGIRNYARRFEISIAP